MYILSFYFRDTPQYPSWTTKRSWQAIGRGNWQDIIDHTVAYHRSLKWRFAKVTRRRLLLDKAIGASQVRKLHHPSSVARRNRRWTFRRDCSVNIFRRNRGTRCGWRTLIFTLDRIGTIRREGMLWKSRRIASTRLLHTSMRVHIDEPTPWCC